MKHHRAYQHKHITRLIWREMKVSERLFDDIMVGYFLNLLKNMNICKKWNKLKEIQTQTHHSKNTEEKRHNLERRKRRMTYHIQVYPKKVYS